MKIFIKKYPIAVFCIFTIFLTVIIGGLNMAVFPASFNYALMFLQWGPCIAAIIIMGIINGKAGIKSLFIKVSIRKSSLKWGIMGATIPIFCCLVTYILYVLIEHGKIVPIVLTRSIGIYLVCLLATIFGSYGEEIGWRGFMLPKLNQKYSLFISSLIVGVVWGLWHMRFQLGLPAFGAFILAVIFFSIFFTWICAKTNGNIFVAIVSHTSINICSLIFFEHILADIANIQTGIQDSNQYLYLKLFGIMALVFAFPCLFIFKNMFGKKTIGQLN